MGNNEYLAVVIGRNRRVYARVYKKESSVEKFALRCLDKEREKAKAEGILFGPRYIMKTEQTETTRVFRVML